MSEPASLRRARPAPPDAQRRMGIGHADYLELFLQQDELGPGLRPVQDSRLKGPDPADVWFPKYQGILTGMAIWMGEPGDTVWRLVDIRTVFPTEWQAGAWHAEAMQYNAEQAPPLTGAPAVGLECRVFGGTSPIPFAPAMMMTAFVYLFRRARVVVKLFVAQGPRASETLTLAAVAGIAQRADERVGRVQARCWKSRLGY